MARRKRHFGSIRRLPSGRRQARYTCPVTGDDDGPAKVLPYQEDAAKGRLMTPEQVLSSIRNRSTSSTSERRGGR